MPVLLRLDCRSTTSFTKFTRYLLSFYAELFQHHSLLRVRIWNCLSQSPIPWTCPLSAVFLPRGPVTSFPLLLNRRLKPKQFYTTIRRILEPEPVLKSSFYPACPSLVLLRCQMKAYRGSPCDMTISPNINNHKIIIFLKVYICWKKTNSTSYPTLLHACIPAMLHKVE